MKIRTLIFIMTVLALVRCNDVETIDPIVKQAVFDASAFVEVTDLAGNPLQGVQVKVGDHYGMTDEDGLLYLNAIEMNPSTYLVAEKPGYFHGSRRFITSVGKTSFVKVVLMQEQLAGTLQANTGGVIQIGEGISLDFPANAVVDEKGQRFAGAVSVYAQPIIADDPDLSYKMPGDLIGLSEDGTQNSLASFGMAVVELRSASGELLQVADQSAVEMKMEIPVSLLATAPPLLPMWYFDEAAGLWKEEGEATLIGNTYVTSLHHFSFWNFDQFFDLIKFSSSFIYEDGSIASQVEVCLTILSLSTTRCAYTDDEGFLGGMVASGEEMLMEVKSSCGDLMLEQQIGPYTDSALLGPITIPLNGQFFTTVSGIARDCNEEPIINGFLMIKTGTHNYYKPYSSLSGEFLITVMNCAESDITIKVLDKTSLKESLPLTFSYALSIDAGSIAVCEIITAYIDLEIVGLPDHFIFYSPGASADGSTTIILAIDSSTSLFSACLLEIIEPQPGVYIQGHSTIFLELPGGFLAEAQRDNLIVTINYYGDVGDYIIGKVSGTWDVIQNGQSMQRYPLAGTFVALRYE